MLSKRELESRYEVWLEQYTIRANIEAETTAAIARTMLLPAARALPGAARGGRRRRGLGAETEALVDELSTRSGRSTRPTSTPTASRTTSGARRVRARHQLMPAMAGVREVADELERVVADDLWPLPKYSEMLFIK